MPIRDTRLMARALNQRWPIKPEYRNLIVNQLMKVIASPDASPREKTAAAKALLSAESQNQADEHKVLDIGNQYNRDRLTSLAERLGVTLDPGTDGSGIEGRDSAVDGDEDSDGETDNTTRA